MATIKSFETKEDRINREIEELRNQIPDINDEIRTGMDRFDLKLNNGGTITEEDVRNLYRGIFKKDKLNTEIGMKIKEKGIDIEVRSLGNLFDEAAREIERQEVWEARKAKLNR